MSFSRFIPRRLITRVVLVAAVVLTATGVVTNNSPSGAIGSNPAHAAAQSYYLKIDGVLGDSTNDTHKDEIVATSFSWGEPDPGIVSEAKDEAGNGTTKPTVHDIVLTLPASKASPKLMAAAASGKQFATAAVSVQSSGETQRDVVKLELSDVIVTSYRTAADGVNGTTDRVTLSFSKIAQTFAGQTATGTPAVVTSTFDAKTNTIS